MKCQGYIGITKNYIDRFRSHKSMAKSGKVNKPLYNAINKYEDIKFTVLCVGSKGYIADLEFKLRPEVYIGWNLAIGGLIPCSGIVVSEESKYIFCSKRSKLRRPDVIMLLINYYIHCMSIKELSDKYNIVTSTCYEYIKGENYIYPKLSSIRQCIIKNRVFCPKRVSGVTEEIYTTIIKLKKGGASTAEIGKSVPVSEGVVRKILRNAYDKVREFKSYEDICFGYKALEYNNEKKLITEWSKDFGISYTTIVGRLRSGLPVDKALSTGRLPNKNSVYINYKGKITPLADACRSENFDRRKAYQRLAKGWDEKDIFKPTQNTLSNEEVREIRRLLEEGDLSQNQIKDLFGISQPTVSAIKLGRLYKNVK